MLCYNLFHFCASLPRAADAVVPVAEAAVANNLWRCFQKEAPPNFSSQIKKYRKMNTSEFLNLLKSHPDKELIFEYRQGFFVPMAYHITEVKNLHIEAVDCGGRPSEDFQTVVQLWVSGDEQTERHLSTDKALKIFDIVRKMKPMRGTADILFEWGDQYLPTSNYRVNDVEATDNQLVVKMFVPPTVCKPKLELELAGCSTVGCC